MKKIEELYKYIENNRLESEKMITKSGFKKYYEEMKLEKIKDKMLVEELINNACNSSSVDVITIIQNSYNILQVKESAKLKVDGVMDKKTINALNNYKNPLELFVWVNMNQFNHFNEHDNSEQFMRNWINDRVIRNVRDYFIKSKEEE
jgi:lysozyme family protein